MNPDNFQGELNKTNHRGDFTNFSPHFRNTVHSIVDTRIDCECESAD
jgi:hypothetical protein